MFEKIKCTLLDSDGKKILCDLNFEGNLLIANMSDYVLDTHTIANTTIDVVEPTNKLKDENGDDRFTFLFNGSSSYSDIEYVVYYDTLTNEAFMINNVDYCNVSVMENDHINLYGYKLGTNSNTSGSNLNMTAINSTIKLPEINESLETVEIVQLNLHGITTRFNYIENTDLDTDTSGYRNINLNTFIKVDKKKLFGDSSTLPMNSIYPSTMIKFNTKYVGEKNLDYLYIPIPV